MAKKGAYFFEIIENYPKKRHFSIEKQTNSFLKRLGKKLFGR